jgi:copper chaperone
MPTDYAVAGMTCQGCVAAVRRAIQRAAPGAAVTVDLASGRVSVAGASSEADVRNAIIAAGYSVCDAAV